MSVKINEGLANSLQITLPAKGETGWSNKVRQAFQDIGDHDHTGGGKGTPINSNGIANNAIKNQHLSSEITLASLGDVQDTDQSAANLAGKILTFSNGAFRPLEFNSQNFTDIDTVININTQTELDGTTFPRGSVVSVRNTTGTGYPSGAADFSSNTLDGITIVADYSVKTSIITNCTIMCSDTVELAGLTTNCKIHSNNTLILSSGNVVHSNLHADTLNSTNSATISVQKTRGFFNTVFIQNTNLTIENNSRIEALLATQLSGTPSSNSIINGPLEIVGGVVRKQVLPETSTTNDFLKWTGSAWGGEQILQVPSGGTPDHVLTKTSSGYNWAAIPEKSFVKIKVSSKLSSGSIYVIPSGCYVTHGSQVYFRPAGFVGSGNLAELRVMPSGQSVTASGFTVIQSSTTDVSLNNNYVSFENS